MITRNSSIRAIHSPTKTLDDYEWYDIELITWSITENVWEGIQFNGYRVGLENHFSDAIAMIK